MYVANALSTVHIHRLTAIKTQTHHKDAAVVVDVEKAELLPFAAQDNKNSVEKVKNLGCRAGQAWIW